MNRLACGVFLALASMAMTVVPGLGQPQSPEPLPRIGAAPDFTLTTQNGGRLRLDDLRGNVVVMTFIYASCVDTCPLLTAKLAALAPRLRAGAAGVHFLGVTVDPERDTPDILHEYARRHGLGRQWTFLTGNPAEIREVARRYGVYFRKSERGDVDHTFLTSLIDPSGILRVQYMGVRFDPDEMLRDVRSLLNE
ncbi:MAG TPA: SCO family protein [Methylomirabilota bacterium]|nr:SCO family protein [Methylomirabilota bacterium]